MEYYLIFLKAPEIIRFSVKLKRPPLSESLVALLNPV